MGMLNGDRFTYFEGCFCSLEDVPGLIASHSQLWHQQQLLAHHTLPPTREPNPKAWGGVEHSGHDCTANALDCNAAAAAALPPPCRRRRRCHLAATARRRRPLATEPAAAAAAAVADRQPGAGGSGGAGRLGRMKRSFKGDALRDEADAAPAAAASKDEVLKKTKCFYFHFKRFQPATTESTCGQRGCQGVAMCRSGPHSRVSHVPEPHAVRASRRPRHFCRISPGECPPTGPKPPRRPALLVEMSQCFISTPLQRRPVAWTWLMAKLPVLLGLTSD